MPMRLTAALIVLGLLPTQPPQSPLEPSVEDVLATAEEYASRFDGLGDAAAEEHFVQEVRRRNSSIPGLPTTERRAQRAPADCEVTVSWVPSRATTMTRRAKGGGAIEGRAFYAPLVESAPLAPTFPLLFLHARYRHRFGYRLEGGAMTEGRQTMVGSFIETARPTFFRGRRSGDAPAHGRFWIDDDGAVIRAELTLDAATGDHQIVTTALYGPAPGFDVLMPAETRTVYRNPGDRRAAYSIASSTFEHWRTVTRTGTGEAVTTPEENAAKEPISEAAILVERVGRYVDGYFRSLTAVVAEESYSQTVSSSTGSQTRRLRSDMLLVRLSERERFGFRDVYEVDGRPVRKREERLRKLFLGRRIDPRHVADESARYNIGSVRRNINVPMTALLFMHPSNHHRIRYADGGPATPEGGAAREVMFREVSTPTIVQSTDGDVPATGTFWINPATGLVLRTGIVLGSLAADIRATVNTTYRFEPSVESWVPSMMRESYESLAERTECVARYSNFRKFNVIVGETVKLPPRP